MQLHMFVKCDVDLKMKIAQVTNNFWPKKYGSNELFLSRGLASRGHEVTVLTAKEAPLEYAMLG